MECILQLEHIYKYLGERLILDDISMKLMEGEILGIVGESGSGKTTLARIITGLIPPDSGKVLLRKSTDSCHHRRGSERGLDRTKPEPERDIPHTTTGEGTGKGGIDRKTLLSSVRDRETHRRIQMVFQNPESSLNPRKKIGRILSDAMSYHIDYLMKDPGGSKSDYIREHCRALTESLGLPADTPDRYPGSFSGGQKQRIALARALLVEPDILVADEPTSALDVSVQFELLKLIRRLQETMGMSVIFISHDLGVIKYLCDRIIVLKSGKIIETSAADDFFKEPQSAYGKELLDAARI